VAVHTQNLLSEEEFLALPEFMGKQELLDGELVELPPAKLFHGKLAALMFELLRTVVGPSRVFIEVGYRLGPRRWLIPDVSVTWPDQQIEDDWPQGSPMLAVEIASRGNTAEQMEKKRLLYLECGAAEVWEIYPKTRTMLVSRKDGTLRISPTDDYRCELFGITITPEYRTPAAA
jgi:Uma2 family endonuclease